MSNPFEVLEQRTEGRVCADCGEPFETTIIVTARSEIGGGSQCEACVEAEDRRRAEQEAADKRQERVMRSGMPSAFRRIGFDGFAFPAAVEAAQAWAADGGGLCLHGAVGVGKTRLAAAACNLRLEHAAVRWVSVARLMTQIRSSFTDDARYEATRIITGRGGIVLDDLDKVNPTDYGREILFAAIDGRIEAGAALLVTTNLPPSQIGERLGDPIMSRIAGYCDVLEMTGPDRRVAS